MDARQFDTIVKGLAQVRLSRLAALRRFAASALAGVTIAGSLDGDSEAKRRNKRKQKRRRKEKRKDRKTKRKEFERIGESCNKEKPCGKYTRCVEGLCAPTKCLIDGVPVDDRARNPDKPCQYCNPNLFGDRWREWDTFNDGTTCPPENSSNLCLSTLVATCQDGACLPEPVANGNSCGDNLVCCDGVCCGQWECCSEEGTCQSCGQACEIGGVSYPAGTPETPGGCRICDPNRSETEWSLRDDGESCGETAGRTCCNGICCAPTECCVGLTCQACECEDGSGRRRGRRNATASGDTCALSCEIDGQSYADGELNPANPCEVCDVAQDPSAWSPVPFLTKCGANLDQICCNGVCCPDGECCRPGFASCSIEWCGIVDPCPYVEEPCGCTIDGQFYAHQTINPANECQWCDAYWSTTAWTGRPSYVRCGTFADRFCCEGVCCETGSCCNDEAICETAAPGCVGCTISGRFYRNGERNPDDLCQQCLIDESTTAWSNTSNGYVCEAVIEDGVYYGDRVCCEGVCCGLYECCNFSNACELTSSDNCQ